MKDKEIPLKDLCAPLSAKVMPRSAYVGSSCGAAGNGMTSHAIAMGNQRRKGTKILVTGGWRGNSVLFPKGAKNE